MERLARALAEPAHLGLPLNGTKELGRDLPGIVHSLSCGFALALCLVPRFTSNVRKPRHLVIAIASLVVILVLAGILGRNSQPRYMGRSLEGWLVILDKYRWSETSAEGKQRRESAIKAVRAIGANALPHLIQWLPYEPTKLDGQFYNRPAFRSWATRKWHHQTLAIRGFEALGPQGAAAAPVLTQMFFNTNQPYSAGAAAIALGATGADGLACLIKTLASPDATLRQNAVLGINAISASYAPEAATVALIECTKDPSRTVATLAIHNLAAEIRPDPARLIPVLMAACASPDASIRSCALEAFPIERLSPAQANPVATIGRSLLLDPVPFVRMSATNLLRRFVAQGLTNAPPSQ